MTAELKWLDRRRPEPETTSFGPIGVYFTQDNLHLVQLERMDGGKFALRARAALAYPGSRTELMATPAAVAKLVRRAMRTAKFRGRKVVSAMPPELVRVMSVSYPANSGDNAAASIARLMADRVDGPLTDYVIDFVPIRMSSHDGDRLALVAVSKLDDANGYLDCLESAGLHVDFLEIGPIAIKRLISTATTRDFREHVFVLNVGETSTNLTTISGERLLADQRIEFGENRILNAVANSLDLNAGMARDLILENGLDPARPAAGPGGGLDVDVATTLIEIVRPEFLRLVREIERAFLYADSESHGDTHRKIVLTGGISRWSGAAALLGSLTRTPVESLGRTHLPFVNGADAAGDIDDQQAAEMSTAVGLALRGITDNE